MGKNVNLFCKPLLEGIMVFWEEVEDAAAYDVVLYINDTPISKKTVARSELYCFFKGLAAIDGKTVSTITSAARLTMSIVGGGYSSPQYSGLDYYVQVKAENRKGEIIATSEKLVCKVKEF